MLKTLGVLGFFWTAMAYSATDTVLICKSLEQVEGESSVKEDFVYLTAYLESNEKLSKVEIKGAYVASEQGDLDADLDYQPKSPRYLDYHRFGTLEDAWNWFIPLMPKNISEREGHFKGYLQIIREEYGFIGTLTLDCFLLHSQESPASEPTEVEMEGQ